MKEKNSNIDSACNSQIIPVYQRYIAIDENIHAALSLHSLSLYMAFRYEADYRKEASTIKRDAKFLYKKAKISRAQYFRSLNELEAHGLIIRDENNNLGEPCTFHIARELGFFTDRKSLAKKEGVSDLDGGVSDLDGGVSNVDTCCFQKSNPKSFYNINPNSPFSSEDSKASAAVNFSNNNNLCENTPEHPKKQVNERLIRDMIQAYREVFPNNPQPHPYAISTNLRKVLEGLIKKWPNLSEDKEKITSETFREYLEALKITAPRFSLSSYETKGGIIKKNSLETFARWNTVVNFLEGKYS